jgi:hypothetical protein
VDWTISGLGGGRGIAENFKYTQINAGVAEASIISYNLCVKAELQKNEVILTDDLVGEDP